MATSSAGIIGHRFSRHVHVVIYQLVADGAVFQVDVVEREGETL